MSVRSLNRVLERRRSERRSESRRSRIHEGAVDCGTIEDQLTKAGMSGRDLDDLWDELGNPSGSDKIEGSTLLYCLETIYGSKDKAEQIYKQTDCYIKF